jgi:hypothetical protein
MKGFSVFFAASGMLLWRGAVFPQDRPLFVLHERLVDARHPNPSCKPAPYERVTNYAEVSVFKNRDIVYRTSSEAHCEGAAGDPSWARRWEAPSGIASTFRYTLSLAEFEQFKLFIDRPDVKGIESFMNAGPGVGDFKITIARSSSSQKIDVVSLMPNHYSLIANPALTQLICMAKAMAQRRPISGELPAWCRK